jgi:hypothetical protein
VSDTRHLEPGAHYQSLHSFLGSRDSAVQRKQLNASLADVTGRVRAKEHLYQKKAAVLFWHSLTDVAQDMDDFIISPVVQNVSDNVGWFAVRYVRVAEG